MKPFVVTEETKQMVIDNICCLLNNFLRCSAFENVIFCWVMHEQSIIDSILQRLDLEDVQFQLFTLTISARALQDRLARDIEAGIRNGDIVQRSSQRLPFYDEMDSIKIDVSEISAREAAETIAAHLPSCIHDR